jgi:hypothetical protein
MELASRIISVLLGLVVAVFILWPVTIPVGFGQAWWASKQMAAPPASASSSPAAEPAETALTPAQHAPAQTGSAPLAGPSTQESSAQPDEGKHALLAAEKAEADRIAALDSKNTKDAAPATPPVPTKLYYKVAVRDAATLQSGGTTIRLLGIAARDA